MKVKKYTAPTMPEAMKIVRGDLGQSAVILNSREARTKGFLGLFRKKYIEVFAAVDPNPVREQKPKRQYSQIVNLKREETTSSNTQQTEAHEDIRKELNELRKQLQQTSTNQQDQILPDPVQNVCKDLQQQELHNSLIDELIPKLLETYYTNQSQDEETLKQYLKQYFIDQLIDSEACQPHDDTKYIYLLGPTGVGKTTTIAKLAAFNSITDGKKIAFITLDTYRIAAIDQLKTYAKILNVPIEVAYNKEDFEAAKDKFKDYDLVFIDTAGRNYRKDEYINQVKEIISFNKDEEIYCVLSLNSKYKDLEDIFNRFSTLGINRVIFTKADETTQFGPIYNLWNDHRFKISYLTYGQSVPDDIKEASPELIVKMLVGEKQW
ncbi:flagellar biosynthesis protein FlhF [Aquisalibacillus elongatus]|uniref:Flagellar biosynthesis protein FlhF n=1 Tax=Aquisalibacillus elongatus TaxID=485577 RepID=A0A3N5C1L9_9BACI|nr:flagellar biosynthesis protein FlhF [Aquisalibacillus elongatus]RPF55978.1 flagellar biosynthesis protein FlhF [Aquisalibacillus elongatus]